MFLFVVNWQNKRPSSSSSLEPKMGGRKRDANGKIIPSPSDLNRDHKARNRPGRRNGTERAMKSREVHEAEVDKLAEQSGMEVRRCGQCKVVKSLDSFSDGCICAPTSSRTRWASCTLCLDTKQSHTIESGETKYTLERARTRTLAMQALNKATLFGTEGYEDYAAACLEANPEKNSSSSKTSSSTARDGSEDS